MNRKENAISKINTMGKVGAILALITKILLIILLVCVMIGTLVLAVLPKDIFSVNMRGNADVLLDLSSFGENVLKEADKDAIEKEVKGDQRISYAGNHFEVTGVEVDTDKDTMRLAAEGELTNFTSGDLIWALVGAIIYIIFTLITVIFIGRLAKAIRDCHSPFEGRVIKRMKQLAYSMVPWVLVGCVVNALEGRIWSSGAGIHFELNVSAIIVVLVILALSYIFQYGAVLQQESDETL